ncbi:hypothetical protein [Gracilibacillus xinjiangensis]|uniref:Uncharacterized protein n=1 Tax=Gracilibacillus xinjiangensis TaxID=1193282 RepID=A0ABV8WWP2_9BACI
MDESLATKQDILMSTIQKLSANPKHWYMDNPILAEELASYGEVTTPN